MKKEKELFIRIKRARHFISKKVGKAICDYDMLSNKDRVLVAVSGGKDSITLLKMLKFRQSFAPIKFDIMAAHINLGTTTKQEKSLERFFKKQNIDYRIKRTGLFKGNKKKDMNCFWCSWNRRKELFLMAGKYGFNKVALGHHFDDIVQTILLNLFFQGEISAMNPKQELFNGKITLIRPLAYVEEDEIARFARLCNDFPHTSCSCEHSDKSKRALVDKLIRTLKKSCPNVKKNIFKSIQRIKKDYLM